ncbi:zinc finger and SCAN domain-containing protein 21-like isoform X2 [Xiphias gladius]|uniref:zinc finger and SCAN domain-containing protein 21-like isoform X2 n=1 Tax=Xiphias gladius TaxID=8245 RepID=UPI001A980A82|nr:zinc finger and SCAN domain-containing protein 21-like isoform X2 [Xiphias gladius]
MCRRGVAAAGRRRQPAGTPRLCPCPRIVVPFTSSSMSGPAPILPKRADVLLFSGTPLSCSSGGKMAIILNDGHANKSTPAAASPGALDSSSARKARETSCHPSDLQCVFTSRTDFLKVAASDNCPYCLKRIQATETHLMRRHYLFAVHFTEDGTERFVVPCMCKDRIQGRSHWHCPYCKKIIYRKCNFEGHISKQHGYIILQQSQDEEIDQPSVCEEEVPLSPKPWCQQEPGSLDQDDQQASLLFQVKEEQEEEMWRQGLAEEHVSHLEFQHSEQLQIKGELIKKGNSQVGEKCPEADRTQDSAFSIVCVDSFIQDIGEINCVQSSKGHPLPNSSTRPLETQPDSGVGEIWQPAGGSQHTTGGSAVTENGSISETEEWKRKHTTCSRLKALNSKKNLHVKRSLPPSSLNIKKSTQLSANQNPAGPHCCKSCGKIFHYMYTLRTHAQTHTVDKILICGICGKHLESTESLVHHLQSHTKRNKCGICGKQFSSNSRLKRHRRFHRPKGLNVTSSA